MTRWTEWTEWAESLREETPASICISILYIMLLCCCWPVHKCVTALSCFDTLIVAVFTYKYLLVLMDTINEPHWTTILSFLFFLSFLICQVIATGFVILAQKKNIAHYCWPRLVLITGLVVCSTIACIVMLCYFGGAASAMNNFFFNAFEYFFYQTFDENQRAEIKSELKLYAAALFVLAITFGLYSVFELLLTRKFYMSLSQFSAVPQIEPSAPHPAYNPDYTQPPTKICPNIA